MKNLHIKSTLFVATLLIASISVKAQTASLKVSNGILYTIDGVWGNQERLHYSTGKGFNYRASTDIEPGEHVLEYYLMKEKQVYNITFTAKPDKKYTVYNEDNKPIVKEDKIILTNAIIENVSSKSGNDDYQIIPGITDTLSAAYLYWEESEKNFSKFGKPDFELRRIDRYWGDGSTGYISGMFNDIGDGFKVMMPAGEHTLSAFLTYGSATNFIYFNRMFEFTYNFEAGKTYKIVFDKCGADEKTKISKAEKIMILNSAHIVEVKK